MEEKPYANLIRDYLDRHAPIDERESWWERFGVVNLALCIIGVGFLIVVTYLEIWSAQPLNPKADDISADPYCEVGQSVPVDIVQHINSNGNMYYQVGVEKGGRLLWISFNDIYHVLNVIPSNVPHAYLERMSNIGHNRGDEAYDYNLYLPPNMNIEGGSSTYSLGKYGESTDQTTTIYH